MIYECLLNCNLRPSLLKVESMKKGRRSKSSVPWSYYRVWQRESNARSLELIGGFSRRRSESEGSICKEAYLSIEAFFSLSQCILSTRSRHNKRARENWRRTSCSSSAARSFYSHTDVAFSPSSSSVFCVMNQRGHTKDLSST